MNNKNRQDKETTLTPDLNPSKTAQIRTSTDKNTESKKESDKNITTIIKVRGIKLDEKVKMSRTE